MNRDRLNAKILSKALVSRQLTNKQAIEQLKSVRKHQRASLFLATRGLESIDIPVEIGKLIQLFRYLHVNHV